MSTQTHIKSLQSKHAELETLLSQEIARPNPDFYVVKDMKKQKLMIKQEIFRLIASLPMQQQNAS